MQSQREAQLETQPQPQLVVQPMEEVRRLIRRQRLYKRQSRDSHLSIQRMNI